MFVSIIHIPNLFYAQSINDSLYTNANAIILLEEKRVELKEQDSYILYHKRKIKILNKKADSFQNITLQYKSSSDKIKDLNIVVYKESGEIIKKVKSSEIDDIAGEDGYSIVTDYRIKHWSYNTSDYPIVIEYEYHKESSNTLSLPQWSPIPTYNIAVLESKYTLITELDVRAKELNISRYESISSQEKSYEMTQQKAIKSEKYSLPSEKIFPIILLLPTSFEYEDIKGNYNTWQGYGSWIYDSFLSKKFDNQEELRAEIVALISPDDNIKIKCTKLYTYLQENTRYISVSLEEGGLNPMNPNKVHDVKYGDCKALSFYMKSILELVGIPSNYVEVAAEADYCHSLMTDFPSPYPGNHIIVNIPTDNDTFWIDCTSHNNPFNFLGSFTDNRIVLEINENGGKLVKTPTYTQDKNKNIDTILIDIKAKACTNTSIKKHGIGLQIETALYLSQRAPDKIEDYIKDNYHPSISLKKISPVSIEIQNDELRSSMSYDFVSDNYIESASEYLFVPNKISDIDIPKLPKDGKRDHDIFISRSSITEQTIILASDIPYTVIELKDLDYKSEYGEYKLKVIKSEGKEIEIYKSFTLYEGTYPPQDYEKIKSFFDKCISTEITPLTLKEI